MLLFRVNHTQQSNFYAMQYTEYVIFVYMFSVNVILTSRIIRTNKIATCCHIGWELFAMKYHSGMGTMSMRELIYKFPFFL